MSDYFEGPFSIIVIVTCFVSTPNTASTPAINASKARRTASQINLARSTRKLVSDSSVFVIVSFPRAPRNAAALRAVHSNEFPPDAVSARTTHNSQKYLSARAPNSHTLCGGTVYTDADTRPFCHFCHLHFWLLMPLYLA